MKISRLQTLQNTSKYELWNLCIIQKSFDLFFGFSEHFKFSIGRVLFYLESLIRNGEKIDSES